LITRDTVFFETLARRAMSLIVALRPGLTPAGFGTPEVFACAGAFGAARGDVVFFRVRVMVGDCTEALVPRAALSSNNQVLATGVMGTARQRRVPMPVKMASADCPETIEWTPVAAPVDT